MASTLSILKTVLNLNGMHVTSCETVSVSVNRYGDTYQQTRIHVHARPFRRLQNLCPVCKKKCPGYDTKHKTESTWRAPNLNGVPVHICYRPRRIKCPEHGVHTEFIPWADGNTRFTEDFCNEVAWMVCRMSRSAVALVEDIDWRTVGNCIKAAHNRIEPDVTVRMRNLRRICVDETSYRKGFSYITVVYDMDLNRVVWIHEGNGLEIFRLFCKELTEEERQKIEIVAGDGAKWIDTCVSEYFPNAARCIDFFHVAEWANEKLDKVRAATAAKAAREFERQKRIYQETEAKAHAAKKELAAMPKRGRPSKRKQELLAILAAHKAETAAEGTDSPKRGRPRKEKFNAGQQKNLDRMKEAVKTVKGSKHALGHNPKNCTDAQTERIRLIENSYPDLYRAYQLKESLRLILHLKDQKLAVAELDQWIIDAAGSGLTPMEELSEKIRRHRESILNSIRCQANSAKSEAVNTTIKALIKMARGFRNIGNMIALIFLKCSDLVIPLFNRPQMSPEKAAAARKTANELRKRRQTQSVPA